MAGKMPTPQEFYHLCLYAIYLQSAVIPINMVLIFQKVRVASLSGEAQNAKSERDTELDTS
ncbi:MAG: hypothetical protein EA343_06430 [Nodularia sp. (in: Bacteria)]|nr:MAG: hypothetical protein EA343_06430 [Nodularia sp. (in: cyanobacteria)]